MPPRSNRTDLVADTSRAPGALPADTYGEKTPAEAAPVPAARPARIPNITGPSMRPNEPVQAGLPIGPGPSGHGLPRRGAATLDTYRALLRKTRDPRLAVLIGKMVERRGEA